MPTSFISPNPLPLPLPLSLPRHPRPHRQPTHTHTHTLSPTPHPITPTCILNPFKRPRTTPPPPPNPPPQISRRAFLSLILLSLPLPTLSQNLDTLDHDRNLDLDLPITPKHFPYHEPTPTPSDPLPTPPTIHATQQEYRAAVHLGHPGDTLTTAHIYLLRSSVLLFIAAYTATAMAISDRQTLRRRLPTDYDPLLVARYFAIRPDHVATRLAKFAYEFARFATTQLTHSALTWLDAVWSRYLPLPSGIDPVTWRAVRLAAREDARARMLREGINRLGPAMIKLGQFAGCRPDLFRAPLVRELQKLQTATSIDFPTLDALRVIWDELGASPAVLFERLDTTAVASASLGIVFKGVVDGKNVAVKVQRPGVAETVALDCYIVRGMAGVVAWVWGSRTDLQAAVDEYASRLFEELDYRHELRNMVEFRKRYGTVTGVYLPQAVANYCSQKVLVTEWVDGVKLIGEDCRVRREDLGVVETGIRFALTQLLDKGFLHAVLRTKSGYLAYIDFGLVSEVPAPVRESIVCALMHLIHGEYTLLAECFTGVALMRSDDIEVNLPLLAEALRETFEPTNQAVVAASRKKGVTRFRHFTLIGIVGKLLNLTTRFPFVFNDYFLNNLRCLGMLEGIALNADPNFNILGVIYPYVVKKVLTEPNPRYRRALESLVIDSYGRLQWSRLDQLLQDVQASAATTTPHELRGAPSSEARVRPVVAAPSHTQPASVATRHDSTDRRRRGDKAKALSPELLISFVTSHSGHSLRQYIFARYLSNLERRWRLRIDAYVDSARKRGSVGSVGSGTDLVGGSGIRDADVSEGLGSGEWSRTSGLQATQAGLRVTEREYSDKEGQLRAREFFRSTPWSRRCRVILRLMPGFVVPLVRMVLRVVRYGVSRVIWWRRGEGGVRVGRVGVEEEVAAGVGVGVGVGVDVGVGVGEESGEGREEEVEGVELDEVTRWQLRNGEEGMREEKGWRPFSSSFLERTQRRRLSSRSS